MSIHDHPQIAEHKVDPEELAYLIRAAIDNGNAISFNAPGRSMSPFIRSGDKIFVAPVAKTPIRIGDVLAIVQPDNGRVLAHRVVRITDGQFFAKGDNVSGGGDGWFSFADVLGRVVRIQRNGKERRFGFGLEKLLIALLSRRNILAPVFNFLRRIKRCSKRLVCNCL